MTKGYDPVANGTAERVVVMFKAGLRELPVATKFITAAWG